MNVAVVVGEVVGAQYEHERADGQVILSFDVRTQGSGSPQTVPCSWLGPSAKRPEIVEGASLTIVGSVRRRFYRRGGSTTSSTDVLADRVILGPPSRAKAARNKIAGAIVAGHQHELS